MARSSIAFWAKTRGIVTWCSFSPSRADRTGRLLLSLLAAALLLGCEHTSAPAAQPQAPRAPNARIQRARSAAPPERTTRVPAEPRPRAREEEHLFARYARLPAKSRTRGVASYYGDSLAGNKTASGERYDPGAFTAAHRSLPFGSVVRVVREDSGQVTYVRINDRGPFVRGRVLDLSRAAAESIDIVRRGVARVRVELVERGPERKAPRKRQRRP